jgi:hypothetical protein
MKISLSLTALSLINALRWHRQDMLEMKRPDLSPKSFKQRKKGAGLPQLSEISTLLPPCKRRLTKVQRRAQLRVEKRLAGTLS